MSKLNTLYAFFTELHYGCDENTALEVFDEMCGEKLQQEILAFASVDASDKFASAMVNLGYVDYCN